MNDNHNEDEAPFDGTSEDSTLEDQMSAHIAAIAASGVAAEAEALANRQADMAARNAVKRDWQSSPPSLSLALSLSASLKR